MAESKDYPKRPLGRGLGSLLGEDLIEEFRSTNGPPSISGPPIIPKPTPQLIEISETETLDPNRIWQVDVEKLTSNVYQPRKVFSPEKIKELSDSIREKGILQPIVARRIDKDHFEIIAGERRWRAAQAAGLDKVPVILKEARNQESLELALIENLQRHDLNPIEEAEAYQRLASEFSLGQQEIATKVGKDRATIANSLRLLGLAPEVKLMLAQGDISIGHAKALLALTDPVKQKELAKKINSERLTVRAAEKLINGVIKRKATVESSLEIDVASKLVQGLQDDLAKTLGTKVEIQYQRGQGAISITFYTDEDLSRIIERIKK